MNETHRIATAPSTCIVLAHGSRNPAAVAAHIALCDALQAARPTITIEPAFLELASPSLEDAIEAVLATGTQAIKIFPHFLSPGNHVLVDLPQRIAVLAEQHPTVTFTQLEYLGADPALVELVLTRIEAE